MITVKPTEWGAPEAVQTTQWWDDRAPNIIGHGDIVSPMAKRCCQDFVNVHIGQPIGHDPRGDGLWGFQHHSGIPRWFKLSAFPQAVPENFAITPAHIKSNGFAMLGRMETEGFAQRLLRHAQKSGSWTDFTPADVSSTGLDWFVEMGWLVKKEDGKYGYSIGFVYEFYASDPATL